MVAQTYYLDYTLRDNTMPIKDAFTFKNMVRIFKFLNVVDGTTGELSPPKILSWGLSIGICVVLFQINDKEIDLTVFAGALMTLITAFGVAYKLGQGKKVRLAIEDEEEEPEYGPMPYEAKKPEEEVKP